MQHKIQPRADLQHRRKDECFMAEQTRKKKKKITWILLGGLFILLMLFLAVYLKLASLNKTFADIIERPEVLFMDPEDLDPIDGTPSDIGEDYYYEVEDPNDEAIYKQIPIDEDVFNILMVGSDVRPDEGTGRSDSMMLISYNRENHDMKIISFMRDTWVAIPNREWNRINAAYAFGGIGLAVNTVNENFDLDIQNYAIVEFEGLKYIVDSLDGIELTLDLEEIRKINESNPKDPIPLKAGRHKVNGAQALTHARNRKTGDGDFGRTRRQRDVMMSILSKMKSSLNPIKLTGFVTETLKYVDTNISPDTIFTLGLEILGAGTQKVTQARIPFDDTWSYADKNGRSVITIDLEKNRELLHDFLYEEE